MNTHSHIDGAAHLEQCGVQYPAQGHLNMQTREAGDWTTALLLNRLSWATAAPIFYCTCIHSSVLRSVEHQSVPLALDVVILRLLSDIETIKLQLSGELLLSLEDDQRYLQGEDQSENNLHGTYKQTQQRRWIKHHIPWDSCSRWCRGRRWWCGWYLRKPWRAPCSLCSLPRSNTWDLLHHHPLLRHLVQNHLPQPQSLQIDQILQTDQSLRSPPRLEDCQTPGNVRHKVSPASILCFIHVKWHKM